MQGAWGSAGDDAAAPKAAASAVALHAIVAFGALDHLSGFAIDLESAFRFLWYHTIDLWLHVFLWWDDDGDIRDDSLLPAPRFREARSFVDKG